MWRKESIEVRKSKNAHTHTRRLKASRKTMGNAWNGVNKNWVRVFFTTVREVRKSVHKKRKRGEEKTEMPFPIRQPCG